MRLTILAATLLLPLSVLTQQACPAGAEPVPRALSAWGEGAAVAAGASANAAMEIDIGETFAVDLHPNAHFDLSVAPKRAAAPDSHGGFLDFEVATAGTYRIALSDAAWIEVIAAGKPVTSAAHGHGPACSGMRKIVDFALNPGRHLLQVSGAPGASIRALVVPGA